MGGAGLVFIQILAFNPTRLEEERPADAITQESLLPKQNEKIELSPEIPKDRVPEYSIEGFQYVTTQGGKKIWRLDSEHAFFYQVEGLVHTQVVKAEIYDSEGQTTHASAQEAKYDEKKKDLELYGNVVVTFPSGLVVRSPFALYRLNSKDVIVPTKYRVEGEMREKTDALKFWSGGMRFDQNENIVRLDSNVVTHVMKLEAGSKAPETTTIESDLAFIDKNKNVAFFQMQDSPNTPLRHVRVTQPQLKAEGRRAEFYFSSSGGKTQQSGPRVHQMRLVDEVKIEEEPNPSKRRKSNARHSNKTPQKRYSTSGIAEFDATKNLIILKQYPQVYQGHDTMTGETIIVHRDTDIVEVEQSNAYSDGTDDEDNP